MLVAINSKNIKTNAYNAKKGVRYFCPFCHKKVILKQGDERAYHFAHHNPGDNHSFPLCDNIKTRDKTKWHAEWQSIFPDEYQEILVKNNIKKHIADVIVDDIVIEFQKSNISIDDFRSRNNLYHENNLKVIWLFDMTDKLNDGYISNNPFDNNKQNEYEWSNPNKLFKNINLEEEKCLIYFQFSNDPQNKHAIERVSSSYSKFGRFYTDKNKFYSIAEFKDIIKNKTSELLNIYVPKHNNVIPVNLVGNTILELWNDNYEWITVWNIKTYKVYLIKSQLNKNIKQNNYVNAQASNKPYNFNFPVDRTYYKNIIKLHDYDDNVWRLIHSESKVPKTIYKNKTKQQTSNERRVETDQTNNTFESNTKNILTNIITEYKDMIMTIEDDENKYYLKDLQSIPKNIRIDKLFKYNKETEEFDEIPYDFRE